MNELQLAGWTVWSSAYVPGTRHRRRRVFSVTRDHAPVPETCPRCARAGTMRWDGYRPVDIVDAPAFGHQVRWRLYQRRYRCPCGKIVLQELPAYVTRQAGFTARCVVYMRYQAAFRPFLEVAEEIGVDESTVRRLAKAAWERDAARYAPPTPRWLGIDEIMLPDRADDADPYTRRKRAVLVDLETGQLVDLLKDNGAETVGTRVAALSNPERVEVVVMDFEWIYRKVARKHLKGALVVIDRFHVEEKIAKAFDKVRVAELKALTRAKLNSPEVRSITRMLRTRKRPKGEAAALFEEYLANYPKTAEAYRAKEAFKRIWDTATSPEEARARFAAWEGALPPSIKPAFQSAIDIIGRHAEPVFTYFDGRATNARTETMNATLRRVFASGASHHLETLRAKMLGKARIYVAPSRQRRQRVIQDDAPEITLAAA